MRRIDMQDTTRISNTRYLIIGSSHAGIAALEAIRLLDESGSITMVTREDSMPYSPTILPYVISGEMAPELIHLRDQSYFDQLSINFRSGLAVTGINLDEKWVELESGEKINYEKLLLTTGADAAIPAFPGIESVPYQVVRTLDDALKLRDSIQTAKSAIVIGAGLIAMHTAENLAQSGLQATLIVRRQVSLFAYFDGAAARMIEHIFSDHGVTLATGSGVSEISAANGGCQVSLESGGVRPRISYLDGSNIEVDRGVLVNEKMRTSAQDVWAAGDVAQAPGFFDAGKTVNATLPNASVQGRIAGMDMVKDPALKPYLGSSGLNTFNFFGHHGFSLGLATVTESTDEIEVNTVYLPSSQCYQKLVFKNNRLVGVSAINAKLDPGILRELIQRQVDLAEVKERFASAPLETGRLLMTKLWR
jgi:phenylglyoxylate dehydrogenase epsilon subunit